MRILGYPSEHRPVTMHAPDVEHGDGSERLFVSGQMQMM